MKSIFSLILLLNILSTEAQNLESLRVFYSYDSLVVENCKNPKNDLRQLYFNHLHEGYLFTSIDSIKSNPKNQELQAYITLGELYTDFSIILNDRGKQDSIATQKLPEILNYVKARLYTLENNGYPFSQINITIRDSVLNALVLTLDKGPFITLDSIIGINSPVNSAYLKNYLSLKEGEPYNEEKITGLRTKLNSSSFMKMNGSPSVIFIKQGAKLYLPIEEKKANKFDGIIGIQPNENERTSITGLVYLSLINSLKRGEELTLNWERLLAQNQRLRIKVAAPYLFKTKLGTSFQANIIRQDSTLNRSLLDYNVFYDFSSKSRLSLGIETARNNTNISEQINFQNTSSVSYRLGYSFNNLDKTVNPRKGFSLMGFGVIGEREIGDSAKNQLVNVGGQANYFLPLLKKTALLFQAQGETINSQDLFANELLQVGGLNFIRGVDQRSLNVSSWLTTTIEYRYLFDKSSNVFIFGETHWNESQFTEGYQNEQISAFGIGLSVGTNSGVFSFNYAVSNQFEDRFLFRNAKINFGFSSSF